MGKPIKVLMFGWEFPPFNSGGLGTACLGLVQGLSQENIEVTFVLPKKLSVHSPFAKIIFADANLSSVTVTAINSLLKPYINSVLYGKLKKEFPDNMYGLTLLEEVKLYALRAAELARTETFDVIHAHDWLSFGAGLAAKEVSGKPLVVHVHATEFDRTGGGANKDIYEMERNGMQNADAIITVSNFTKQTVIDRYGILPEKITVVHNGIDTHNELNVGELHAKRILSLKASGKKIVLFVGRITLQKGPDYFLRAAQRVLEYNPDVYFVIAGSGDMEQQIIQEAAWLGISNKIIFAGFLRGSELEGLYKAADLYVMTSVSEPFGLTALEAVRNGTPIIISKQSGVSEVIKNAIKVNFWDIDGIADAIVGVLFHKTLHDSIASNASLEIPVISWRRAAGLCVNLYKKLVAIT